MNSYLRGGHPDEVQKAPEELYPTPFSGVWLEMIEDLVPLWKQTERKITGCCYLLRVIIIQCGLRLFYLSVRNGCNEGVVSLELSCH